MIKFTHTENEEHENCTALDLATELKSNPNAVYGTITKLDDNGYQESVSGSYVFVDGRIGIEFGADADWSSVSSIESGINMYLNDYPEFEANN